jgi:S-(hydroxymethyl)glutathione dehydrogenase/alcohol dehydrogenase
VTGAEAGALGTGASDKKLPVGLMGYNRFPLDAPRRVDFYRRGLLGLNTLIAERLPLERTSRGLGELRRRDAQRSVTVVA